MRTKRVSQLLILTAFICALVGCATTPQCVVVNYREHDLAGFYSESIDYTGALTYSGSNKLYAGTVHIGGECEASQEDIKTGWYSVRIDSQHSSMYVSGWSFGDEIWVWANIIPDKFKGETDRDFILRRVMRHPYKKLK